MHIPRPCSPVVSKGWAGLNTEIFSVHVNGFQEMRTEANKVSLSHCDGSRPRSGGKSSISSSQREQHPEEAGDQKPITERPLTLYF